jgi:hypothetical protein
VTSRPGRLSPDGWSLVAIVGAVLLANLLCLTGVFDPNPLASTSGLGQVLSPGLLPGQATIDPNVGFVSQALSHRAALDLLHFHLPWWNPYEGTGFPLAGEVGAAALFPLTLLTAVANGQLYEHILFEIVAGISTFLVLRRIALGRLASVAGGIAFALNGTFAWFGHPAVNPVAFLPLLILGIERAYSASLSGSLGGWRLLALAGVLSLYAGFPEVTYLNTLFGVLWFAWRCGCLERARMRSFLVKCSSGAVVAVLLCDPLLIDLLDYTGHADVGRHQHGIFSHVAIPLRTMPQLVLPYVFGPILAYTDPGFVMLRAWSNVGGFLSSSLLVLVLLGLLSKGRRGLRWLLALWILVMLARTYRTPGIVADAFNLLPGMSNVAVFRYAWPTVELACVVLAAIGLEGLVRFTQSRRRLVGAAVVSLFLLGVAAAVARPLVSQFGAHREWLSFAMSLGWAAAVVVALIGGAVLLRGLRSRAVLAFIVVVADALLLFAVPELSAPRRVVIDTAPVAYLRRHLGSARYFTLGPLAPNYGSYFGLTSLNANDLPVPSSFAQYVHHHLDRFVDPTMFVGNLGGGRSPFVLSPEQELRSNLAGYRRAGVAYVLTPAGQGVPQSPSTFTLVRRTPTTWLYRLAGAAPYMSATHGGCRITSQGRAAARINCSRPASLVRRETYLPGWSATVDGRDTAVRSAAGGVFQSVHVPAGTHEIRFSFAPPNIGWGGVAFLAGCLVLCGPWLLSWRRRRNDAALTV